GRRAVLAIAALDSGGEIGRGVARILGAEQVEALRVPEVDVFLDDSQLDSAEAVNLGAARLLHQVSGALHDALHAGLADEHVMGLFSKHEAGCARERIEAAL